MTRIVKLLQRMKNNPNGWTIQDLKVIATKKSLIVREGKGSHTIFMSKTESLSVPSKRPIKPIYIKLFLQLVGENDEQL